VARIPFVLPQEGDVRLRVLDLAGRQVRLLMQGRLEAGRREVVWDGRDDGGIEVSGGVYLYEVESPGFRATRRLIRLR
jgi:flagellar hook assembly protein FlgD